MVGIEYKLFLMAVKIPSSIRATAQARTQTIPVVKNEYWRVNKTPVSIRFVPIGTGQCVKQL